MLIVLHRHLREIGYCNRGCRTFFERHGLDWREFLADGIEADRLASTGDAMALKAVEHAAKEAGNGR
jgi:hypothetical protein